MKMGTTEGKVEVKTKILEDRIITATRSEVSDSDGNETLLEKAAAVNVAISRAIANYQAKAAADPYRSIRGTKYIELEVKT